MFHLLYSKNRFKNMENFVFRVNFLRNQTIGSNYKRKYECTFISNTQKLLGLCIVGWPEIFILIICFAGILGQKNS